MRTLSTAILALFICCADSASASEVYRWTNEKGVTQYSDTPPANAKYERVNVRTGKVTPSEPEATEEAAAAATPHPARTQAQVDPVVREQRCQSARRNLIALRSSLEVTGQFDGETRALTAEERELQVAQNERVVTANCEAE